MRLIFFFCLVCFLGCKQENLTVDGNFITNITRNSIQLENGAAVELNVDPGSKVIYLVRHAEKDTVPKSNPILTTEGYDRSYNLATMMKQTRIDAIYSTIYNRTMHTVDSLATLKGLPTNIYQPKDLKQLAIDINEAKDINSVIIAGHSNTTPALANVFMGNKVFEEGFDESDYDNILIVNIDPDGTPKLYKLKFK